MMHQSGQVNPNRNGARDNGVSSGSSESGAGFRWAMLGESAVDEIFRVHRTVLAATPKGQLRPDSRAHFLTHVGNGGVALGCLVQEVGMVAYGLLGLDTGHVADLAACLGICGKDSSRFCILDGAASLPEWRGHHLHRQLIRRRLRIAAGMGRTLVGVTVDPDNARSLRGLLAERFEIVGQTVLYGGLNRIVLCLDMEKNTFGQFVSSD